jgi:superfamily II DNA or RNA helicase
MTATLRLRDYQRETIDALFAAWADGMRRPAVVLPTGAGKTVVFSHLIDRWNNPGYANSATLSRGHRVIVLVHRDELADQAINKIRSVAPHLSVGKVKAGDNDVHADVMVCSVQTVSRHARRIALVNAQLKAGPVGLIITDECHHGAAKSYHMVYDGFPNALHAGFTATLERGDGVGLGSVWDDVVYSRSPLWMMKHGYLVQPRAFTEDVGSLDLKSVKTTGGDYQSGDLGRALEESEIGQALPRACKEHADGRPTVVFTPTVSSAHMVSQEFNAFGTPSAVISGETPREDRHRIFEDFRLGRTKVLVNCMVLTEGWDAPWASCAVIARPTRSRSLYQQMVGRVLRPWKGKTDAVILNVAGGGGRISTLIDLEPGSVQEIGEGEGLLDAEEREELEEAETAAERKDIARQAKLRMTEVKGLFAASHQAWLSTAGGVQFIGAGEWTYFLWPSQAEPGTWDVLRHQKYGKWQRTEHTGLDVELAMSWAEAEAEDHGSFSVSRKASWRSGKPSPAQLDYAYGLGIDATDMKKSQLSDAISYVLESRQLDPYVGVV